MLRRWNNAQCSAQQPPERLTGGLQVNYLALANASAGKELVLLDMGPRWSPKQVDNLLTRPAANCALLLDSAARFQQSAGFFPESLMKDERGIMTAHHAESALCPGGVCPASGRRLC